MGKVDGNLRIYCSDSCVLNGVRRELEEICGILWWPNHQTTMDVRVKGNWREICGNRYENGCKNKIYSDLIKMDWKKQNRCFLFYLFSHECVCIVEIIYIWCGEQEQNLFPCKPYATQIQAYLIIDHLWLHSYMIGDPSRS